MTASRPLNRGELEGVCQTYPQRAADEILRLREALRKAGETCDAARQIAEEALAEWLKPDTFQSRMNK